MTLILELSPLWQLSQSVVIPTTKTKLGDNYSQILPQGISPFSQWDVRSPVYSKSQLTDVLANLRQYSLSSFKWSPTGEDLKECVCDEWVVSQVGQDEYTISTKITTSQVRANVDIISRVQPPRTP